MQLTMPSATEPVYFPICHRCGERGWTVRPRQLDVRCDDCGAQLDHFRVGHPRPEPARPA